MEAIDNVNVQLSSSGLDVGALVLITVGILVVGMVAYFIFRK